MAFPILTIRHFIPTLSFAGLLFLCFFPLEGLSQVTNYPGSPQDPYSVGNQDEIISPFDTSSVDSAAEELEIPPDTRTIDKFKLYTHQRPDAPLYYDFATTHYWDETDRLEGFLYALGQLGKPYALFQYGFSDRFSDQAFWNNPVVGRYNVYALSADHTPVYLDTRTPYVNIRFAQGARRFQRVDITLSRNISPNLNVTLYFQRRQVVGAYPSFTTDHQSLYATSYYRSDNRRYHMFNNWTYNGLKDDINGGEIRTTDSSYEIVDGVIQDDPDLWEDVFLKSSGGATVVLENALRRSLFTRDYLSDHYYHLIGHPDSSDAHHRLTLRALGKHQINNYSSSVFNINRSALENHLVPVLPTLDTAANSMYEAYKSRFSRFHGGASYSLDYGMRINVHGGLTYERVSLVQDSLKPVLNRYIQQVRADWDTRWGNAQAELKQIASNLYEPANQLKVHANLFPLPGIPPYRPARAFDEALATHDSLSLPSVTVAQDSLNTRERSPFLVLSFDWERRSENPQLFFTHFQAREGNTYQRKLGLTNQRFSRYVARATLNRPALITLNDTLLPNYFYAEGFLTTARRFIFFDRDFGIQQADNDETLTWLGLKLGMRIQPFRKIYWEPSLSWQIGQTSSDTELEAYSSHIPALYGKSSLYYENRSLSFAAILKVGLDIHFHTGYDGLTLEPVSGEFFPAALRVPGYVRGDAYFATQIKGAYLYFKMSHLNEGLIRPGYYLTPLYPMLERTFSLGVTWTFFD